MQAIHDYARGHQALLTPGSAEKPDETDAAYSAHIRNLMVQEDFPQLEKIAQQNRVEKGRLLGGIWKVKGFYDGTSWPVDDGMPKDSDWQRLTPRLQRWMATYPNSTAARLTLASACLYQASHARGDGLPDSVSDAQWKLYQENTARAKALLLETSSFDDKDPYWYALMLMVADNEGWDTAQTRELFDQAIAFQPGFYHYYMHYTHYLEPQWYGKPGDILALADEAASRIPEPHGSMLYFWTFAGRVCYCEYAQQILSTASYVKLSMGYANITRLYGVSNLNANRFAFMATTFLDKPAAREAFSHITTMEPSVWMQQPIYDDSRDWANSP
jgi:hypothetical protein